MSEKRDLLNKVKKEWVRYLGILLLLTGPLLLLLTFYPLITAYIDYSFSEYPIKEVNVEVVKEEEKITKEITKETNTVLLDSSFGLYIPKIKANAKVIPNVDPYNEKAYTNALYRGVAHAKGTSTPDKEGNVFLFAHSAVNFYEQRKFNVYFYLLGELEKEDNIYVSYNNEIYVYKVLEVKKVEPTDIQYLGTYMDQDTLTLMTCWPAGSDFRRIIVTAIRAQR